MSESSSHADVGRTDKFLFAGDADAPYLKLVQDTDISLQRCNLNCRYGGRYPAARAGAHADRCKYVR